MSMLNPLNRKKLGKGIGAFSLITLGTFQVAQAQTSSVGIGTISPATAAILDLTSTTKGLLLPRMTQTQRNAIVTPIAGLLIYQTDNGPGVYFYNGSTWTATTPTTLYSGDGTLSGNRVVTMGSNTLQFSGTGTIAVPKITFKNPTYAETIGTNATDDMEFTTNATSSVRMIIKNGGNVGIGTTTPAERLEVNGKVKTSTFQMTTSPTAGYVLTTDASGNGTWQAAGASNSFYTSNGTISGARTIARTSGSTLEFDSTTTFDEINFTTPASGERIRSSGSDLQFLTNFTQRMVVSNTGNVGVGVAAPAEKLEVNGKVKTSTFQMTTSPTAGYVLTTDASGNGTWQAATASNTLYTANGTISGARTVARGAGATLKFDNTTTFDEINFVNPTNGERIKSSGTDLQFLTNNTQRMVISNGGDVTMNNTLNTGGNINVGTSSKTLTISSYSNGSAGGVSFGSDGGAYYEMSGNEYHVFGGSVLPDNQGSARNLGLTTNRWVTVYGQSGDFSGTVTANTFTTTSDIRLKSDIRALSYGLKDVLKINPISYTFKNRHQAQRTLGFSAQELKNLLPEVVHTGTDSMKTLRVEYTSVIPVLVNAIKEQQAQIEELKKQLAVKDATVHARLAALEYALQQTATTTDEQNKIAVK